MWSDGGMVLLAGMLGGLHHMSIPHSQALSTWAPDMHLQPLGLRAEPQQPAVLQPMEIRPSRCPRRSQASELSSRPPALLAAARQWSMTDPAWEAKPWRR